MSFSHIVQPTITKLVWLHRAMTLLALLGLAMLVAQIASGRHSGLFPAFAQFFAAFVAWIAVNAWLQSARRRFIREARLPKAVLFKALLSTHPGLTERDCELVLRGLRQFFLAYSRSGHKGVGMPSKVVDTAWHAFILHTRAYGDWCSVAFGRMLHHIPAEAMGARPDRNDALRRTWFWACKEESIDPRAPTRLPLLFALDAKLSIEGGYRYEPNCKSVGQQSDSGTYCATYFGSSSGGGDGGFPGDGDGFGGSDGGGGDGGGGCGGD